MIGSPRTQRHHYIPQFYLSAWLGTDHQLESYTLARGQVVTRRIGTRGSGFQDDLYAFSATADDLELVVEHPATNDDGPAVLQQLVEPYLEEQTSAEEFRLLFEARFTASIDGRADRILSKLRTSGTTTLTDEERRDWAQFIVSLPLRNPEAVEDIKNSAQHAALQRARDTMQERWGETGQEAELQELLAADPTLQRLAADYGLWVIEGIVRSPDYVDQITSLQWWTVDFTDAKHTLLTSDRPFVSFRPLHHPRSLIYVPIGPRTGFFASPDPEKQHQLARQGTGALAKAMNDVVVRMAWRYVYAVDDAHRQFVANRWRSREPRKGS